MKKSISVLTALATALVSTVIFAPVARADDPAAPTVTVSDSTLTAGQPVSITGTGFSDYTDVTIGLGGDLYDWYLGTLHSDENGDIDGVITVKPSIAAADYSLEAFDDWGNGADTPVTVLSQYHFVILDGRGGGISDNVKSVKAGAKVGYLEVPTHPGYKFLGYYTAKSGGTKVTSSTKMKPYDWTLYAHWSAKKYKVTFNPNGGKTARPKTKTVTMGKTFGKLATTSRTNYVFAGWFTAKSGGTKVTSASKVTKAANRTLYAHWTAKYVSIPDKNLKACVAQALKVSKTSKITVAKAKTLKKLYCSRMKAKSSLMISSLKGLSSFTGLTLLDVDSNHISDLSPISGLTTLKTLDISGNKISNLKPLSKLTNVTSLNAIANKISDISPLAHLEKLEYLDLGVNTISDISPLAGLTNLKWLEVHYNKINAMSDLSQLTRLTQLDLSGNKIEGLDSLSGLTALTDLYLESNMISDLGPLSNLTSLEDLYLDANQISDLRPLQDLTKLVHLGLQENSISDASPLYSLVNLHALYLDYNRICNTQAVVDALPDTFISIDDQDQSACPA